MRATTSSICSTVTNSARWSIGFSRWRAPASSITSIALSGRCRSLMWRADSSAAALRASSAYLTPWCSSNRGAQPVQDLDRLRHRGLDHVDLLEAARERVVLLEDAAVFLVGGRTDAAQLAVRERGLDQVGRVHHATRGGARADHGVDLVDEQDRARLLLDLGEHALQALLEIAAVLGAGDERAQVERVHGAVRQHVGHLALDDHAREAFDQRGLADARLAHVQRVVLAAAAQDLDRALDFERAADQRIDAAFLRELVQVGGELLERRGALGVALALRSAPARLRRARGASSDFDSPWEMKLTTSRREISCSPSR